MTRVPDGNVKDDFDPADGLKDYLCLSLEGEWVPGGLDRPWLVAVFLEYLRRGGDAGPVGGEERYRLWLASNATTEQLAQVMEVAAVLERMTEEGVCADCVGAYLDPMLERLQ